MKKKQNAAERRNAKKQQTQEARLAAVKQKQEEKEKAARIKKAKPARVPVKIPMLRYGDKASSAEIKPTAPLYVHVKILSPLHLGSGGADIHVDADVVQDDVGLPYFPAKRLKGLLCESGLEVSEMAGRCSRDTAVSDWHESGLEVSEMSRVRLIDKEKWDTLFQRGRGGVQQLVISNLYLENYDVFHADLLYLQKNFPSVFRPAYVLDQYASVRYQTAINPETGVAQENSLRNMRVLDAGLTFVGEIRILGGDKDCLRTLALAVRNLSQCGGKRTRGFGQIACTLTQNGKDVLVPLVEEALSQIRRRGGKA